MKNPSFSIFLKLLLICLYQSGVWASAAATISRARTISLADHPVSQTFRVRHVRGRSEVLSDRRRKLFDFQLTFSREGEPIDIPLFQLQLFPTPETLDENTNLIVQAALEDYLRTYFQKMYPDIPQEDLPDESKPPRFTSAVVRVMGMSSILSSNTRDRHHRSLQQRRGIAIDIATTLRFIDGNFPPNDELEANMRDAISNQFNNFLQNYLFVYGAGTELESVDSGDYVSGFTRAPTASPTDPPAEDNGIRGQISQVNQNVQNNANQTGGINALYPAIIVGVCVFILTAVFISVQRKQVGDFDGSRYGDGSETNFGHVSIDYDGRQEAIELEEERRRMPLGIMKSDQRLPQDQSKQQQKALPRQQQHLSPAPEHSQQDDLTEYEHKEIAKRLRAAKRKKKDPLKRVQRVALGDGTTIHIHPGGSYDEQEKKHSSYSRSHHQSQGNESLEGGFSQGAQGDEQARCTSNNNYRPRKLPSMRRGGEDAEFGMNGYRRDEEDSGWV